eukprot:Gregarina_sp_Poly_1__2641@NODE_171_length_12059_cov_195_119163_g152_i0_p3_GENE_NODE_171_length_12059_cov_195_119163_g152_i0NODE_171_length_12059_cov_195_119163_g152_i0_p3_ORF_typecomplete_len453_score60_03RRM_1/PF00076_22/3e09RRM_7/PF16367_5/2_2e05_NODE_171_length_12059_cov_195_119163_g152_i0864510003
MTKTVKSGNLWAALPPSYDNYSPLDSGRLSVLSPSRSPVTPTTPMRPMAMSAGTVDTGFATPPSGKGAQFTIIANVPYDTVRQDLVTEFRKFGRVELAMVVCDEASRHPHKEWTSTAGYAFVRFSKRGEAAAAIQAATMGLITIRGTRVRADWARKDSYAKRGRVSAAQGAPTLGPYGIPDGITMLHDTLSANRQMPPEWSQLPAHPKLRLPDLSDVSRTSSESCTSATRIQNGFDDTSVYESALAQSLNFRTQPRPELVVSHDSEETRRQLTDDLAGERTSGGYPALESAEVETPVSAMIAAEKICNQLIDLLSEESSTSFSSSVESSSYAQAQHEGFHPLSTAQIAELLSPTSRGLLSFALSDVVSPSNFPPDVSPIGKASSTRHQVSCFCSPEDLLKLAVSKFPNAVVPAADESAVTKTGSSSHRSSTGDEDETSSSDDETISISKSCV